MAQRMMAKAGDGITIKALKPDGTCYRSWCATVETRNSEFLVSIAPTGHQVRDVKGDWISDVAIRNYFWFRRPYNLLEVFKANGSLQELYVHIASIAQIDEAELHYTDYELDVVCYPGKEPFIADEDEYAAAVSQYSLSGQVQQTCRAAAKEALVLLRNWNAGAAPDS